jgi:hypothetical protein
MKTRKAIASLALAAFSLWSLSAAFAQSGGPPAGAIPQKPAGKPDAPKPAVTTTAVKPVAATPAKAAGTTKVTKTKETASAAKTGPRSVIGEVVDPACWIVNGAKGASHKECAIACAKAGQVLGIVENKSQKLYMVATDKPGEDPNKGLIDYVGQTVLVKGRVYTRGGATGIKVTSVEPYSATAAIAP